jgi:hypothetical protein
MATKTMLIGKAALTVIRHTNGTRSNIAAGRAVPDSIDPRDADRLLAEGFLEEIEVTVVDDVETLEIPTGIDPMAGLPADDPAVTGDPASDDVVTYDDAELDEQLDGNVGDILDAVGDDAVLAAALLEREQQAEKPRATLVKGLQETVDAANDDGDQS